MDKKPFMHKIAGAIVKFRYIILLLFVGLMVLSAIGIQKTQVNYDMSEYIPSASLGAQSLKVLKEEFGDHGSADVLIRGITKEEAGSIARDLADVSGVLSVQFDVATGYKNGSAIYTVLMESSNSSAQTETAVKSIIALLSGKEAYLAGESMSSYYTKLYVGEELLLITIIVAVLIIAILLLTSRSFFEIFLLILVFGAAALINMGTNFLLGSISYISNSIAIVLQLALAIDYSIIFLHRFTEEREKLQQKEAIVASLSKAIPDILSSSLTTVAGMCALMFMQLSIGFDIGAVMAKGIVISMLTVILLMPVLLMLSAKAIEKTEHRSFIPRIDKPMRKVLSARKILLPIFILIIGVSMTGQFFNAYSFNLNASDIALRNKAEIEADFGVMNPLVVLVPKGNYEKERALIEYTMQSGIVDGVQALSMTEIMPGLRLCDELTAQEFSVFAQTAGITAEQVQGLFLYYMSVHSPSEAGPPAEYRVELLSMLEFVYSVGEQMGIPIEFREMLSPIIAVRAEFEGENYSRIIFNINAGLEDESTLVFIEDISTAYSAYYPQFYICGESVVLYEMQKAFPRDNMVVTLFTIAFILLVLLVTFRNFLIPLLLVFTIQGAIWVNFLIPLLSGNPMIFIGYLLVSAIQMGATIDYAIVLTSRYREMRKNIPDKSEAMVKALSALFPTILSSGLILTLTGFVLSIFASASVTAALGSLLGAGTLISILMVLFVLPPLLLAFDRWIIKREAGNKRKKYRKLY